MLCAFEGLQNLNVSSRKKIRAVREINVYISFHKEHNFSGWQNLRKWVLKRFYPVIAIHNLSTAVEHTMSVVCCFYSREIQATDDRIQAVNFNIFTTFIHHGILNISTNTISFAQISIIVTTSIIATDTQAQKHDVLQ